MNEANRRLLYWGRIALAALFVFGVIVGIAFGLGRDTPAPESPIAVRELYRADLVGEPDKEVDAKEYVFAPGAAVPWHIHPDAHEFDYMLEGSLTLEMEGEEPRVLNPGEVVYVPPNVVHRGMNEGSVPAKIVVIRIKPKDQPLTREIER